MGDEKHFKELLLASSILVLVAGTILAGIAVIVEYREFLEVRTSAINETVTFSGGTGTLSNDQVQTIIAIENGSLYNVRGTDTVAISFPGATAGASWNITTAGVIVTNMTTDQGWNVSYTYDNENTASNTAEAFITGLRVLGSFSALLAIALIGIVIVRLFKKQ